MTLLFCLACATPVEWNPSTLRLEDLDGSADCRRRRAGHRVEPIMPDPPKDKS